MEKKVNNLKELAEKLKLSPTTVSRVLNGKSEKFRISKKTSQKVWETAREYQYSANRIARGLKLEKTETIGLIIPDIANPYFGSIAKTIEVEARNSGYSIILCDSLDDEATEAELLQLMAGRKVDGIIIAPTGKSSRHVAEIQQQGIPVMVIDRYLPDTDLPFVTTDNYRGGFLATQYFIEKGHRNIACVQGINDISANSDRVKGYRDTLQKHGISVNETMILGTDFGEENGYVQTQKLLKMADRPTAIFALSNLISLGVLRALKGAQLSVPEDISIVSFDEQPYSAFLSCPMTTVEQPREEIGKLAFKNLLRKIKKPHGEKIENTMIKPRLIIRDSVKNVQQKNDSKR